MKCSVIPKQKHILGGVLELSWAMEHLFFPLQGNPR